MIEYTFESSRYALNESEYTDWLIQVVESEGFTIGEISYVFVNDEDLRIMNRQYLDHDYFTDIITFDYSTQKELNGDIFISVDRVRENAIKFKVSEEDEFKRVMVHGVLHLMGYDDGTPSEKKKMRALEDNKLKMFHVEQ